MPRYSITIEVDPTYQEEFEDAVPEIISMGWPIAIKNSAKVMDVSATITKVARHAQKEEVWKKDE